MGTNYKIPELTLSVMVLVVGVFTLSQLIMLPKQYRSPYNTLLRGLLVTEILLVVHFIISSTISNRQGLIC